MERSNLALITSGAFWHPFGDQTPIESRWAADIDSPDLCHRQMLFVEDAVLVPYGNLVAPIAVLVWNVAGVGQQTVPTDEERAAIEARVLLVGLTPAEHYRVPDAWQVLPPPPIGSGYSPAVVLHPHPDTHVIVKPAAAGVAVPVRVLVIPNSARQRPGGK